MTAALWERFLTRKTDMYVIGTAGHVDHGKTTLVQALTGINPDRLQEEQRRGMTIELGFAWLTLPSGREVSLVDVPGHERFIKHMLAGVGGFDGALLVVAADESVMPQTREHLAIIDLLEIRHGLVVVTKADMVDPAWLPLVLDDIRTQLSSSALAQAPLVVVSARHGQGIDTLRQSLDEMVNGLSLPARRDEPARLWVDRVFSIDGFGAVVTGTLQAATLAVGMEVEVAPRGLRARIRGLQMHRSKIEVAHPGTRVAINLAGISHHEIARGDLITLPRSILATQRIDVRLHITAIAPRAVTQGMHLDLFVGAAETRCRVTILDGDGIAPGEHGLVQLHLEQSLPLWRGDRLIVRQASPSITMGGGKVIATHPARHRRMRPDVIASLTALERATPADLCWSVIHGHLCRLSDVITQTHLPEDLVRQTLVQMVMVVQLADDWVADTALLDGYRRKIDSTLASYLARAPLRIGMPREELRRRLELTAAAFDALLLFWHEWYEPCGEALIRPKGYQVLLTTAQQQLVANSTALFAAAPFNPPELQIERELLAYMQANSWVIEVAEGMVFHFDAWQELATWVLTTIDTQGSVSVAQLRDRFDTTRKYALAVLEYMDTKRITRRHDEVRVRF